MPLFSRFIPIFFFLCTCVCLPRRWPNLQLEMPRGAALVEPRHRAHHKSHTARFQDCAAKVRSPGAWCFQKVSEQAWAEVGVGRSLVTVYSRRCNNQDNLFASLPPRKPGWTFWQRRLAEFSQWRWADLKVMLPSFHSHFQLGQVWW